MKTKYLFMAALGVLTLASCADDGFVGDKDALQSGYGVISFDLNTPAVTRAADKTGADAAGDLNNRFVVWGEKNEAGDGTAAGDANLVFKNYKVEYTANTAYTTTSNTKDWEYVGLTPYTQVTPYLSTTQTIKYWDYAATKYTFTAVSAKDADITSGKVVIAKNTTGSSSSDFNKGYEIEVKTDASLDNIFIADRNVINQSSGTDRTATNAYGGNVTMRFRNFMSKIRFGIYENISGYKVKITKVYYNNTNSTTKFGVDGKFLTVGDGSSTHTIFTVTYENPSNKAVVDVKSGSTPVNTTYFETVPGTVNTTVTSVPFLSADYIGTTSTGATFNKTVKEGESDAVNGVYTTILPFSSNDANIKLKIDYQLISEDTNETINITGKTAEVPTAYCQWKSNYAYSYIFKITDDDLYPITFDAVEVVDENGEAEFITTVTEPSITTFGVVLDNSNKFKEYVTGKDDYQLPGGTDKLDIYVTIMDGSIVADPTLGTNVNVYSVSTSDATNFPITEASLAEAIAETGGSAGEKITYTLKNTDGTTSFNAAPDKVTSVPGEDGVDKTINALKLTGVKEADTYAVEYINGKAYTPAADTDVSGGTWFTDVQCTTAATGTANGSTTYYKRENKTYKVIKVVSGS